jgi:hypothetical protein
LGRATAIFRLLFIDFLVNLFRNNPKNEIMKARIQAFVMFCLLFVFATNAEAFGRHKRQMGNATHLNNLHDARGHHNGQRGKSWNNRRFQGSRSVNGKGRQNPQQHPKTGNPVVDILNNIIDIISRLFE